MIFKSHGHPMAMAGPFCIQQVSLGARQLKFGEVPAMKKFDARTKTSGNVGFNGDLMLV